MELLFFSEMNEGTKQGLQNLFDGPGSIVWILFGIFVVVSGVLQILDGWQHDKDIKDKIERSKDSKSWFKKNTSKETEEKWARWRDEHNIERSKDSKSRLKKNTSKETEEKWARWREERKKK